MSNTECEERGFEVSGWLQMDSHLRLREHTGARKQQEQMHSKSENDIACAIRMNIGLCPSRTYQSEKQ